MADSRRVVVAAVQATPVILNAQATVDKAVELLGKAAAEGARLAVFPETFISVYPSGAWGHQASRFDGFGEMWERLWENSIEIPGPAIDRLVDACRELDIFCVIGFNEREVIRPGSLYNTMALLGPDGVLLKHRKLVPTMHERLFHGAGSGLDLTVAPTDIGRIGGLICWENRMPLARYALYQQGVQIWVAPTADDSDGWLASMRHIAIESGAFVISVPQFIPADAFPDDFPVSLPDMEIFGRGGAAIIEPQGGEVIAGPLYDGEGIITAEIDLSTNLRAKRWFDVVGHYSAPHTVTSMIDQQMHPNEQHQREES